MEPLWIWIGGFCVILGGAWAGAKAAFVVTLILRGLFGRATQQEQRHVVYVQPPQYPRYPQQPPRNLNYEQGDVIDVDLAPRYEHR